MARHSSPCCVYLPYSTPLLIGWTLRHWLAIKAAEQIIAGLNVLNK